MKPLMLEVAKQEKITFEKEEIDLTKHIYNPFSQTSNASEIIDGPNDTKVGAEVRDDSPQPKPKGPTFRL